MAVTAQRTKQVGLVGLALSLFVGGIAFRATNDGSSIGEGVLIGVGYVAVVLMLTVVVAVLSRGRGGEDRQDPGADTDHGEPAVRVSALSPHDRAAAIRRGGFREPIAPENRQIAVGVAVASMSAVVLGAFGLITGEGIGGRLPGLVMLAVGAPLCWKQWVFYARPAAPSNDADLAREVRHRDDQGRPT